MSIRVGRVPSFAAGMAALAVLSFLIVSKVAAAGYKIPEQSSSAVALSAAFVANAEGAAAVYYNPANMVFGGNGEEMELGLSFISLPPLRFSGSVLGAPADARSKEEAVLLPNFHYVFPQGKTFRFGISLSYPFGLSKRWDSPFQKLFAEEFTLKTIELNAVMAARVTDYFSVGGGLRGIYSEGTVKSDGAISPSTRVTREVEGDAFSPGYILALSYRPIKNIAMAATYRSEVIPNLEGRGKLSATGPLSGTYDGPASVEVVLPATAQLATAVTLQNAVFEFVYERTYWERYKSLDFAYDSTLNNPVLIGAFDDPVQKNWSDSNTYRMGFSYQYDPATVLMLGFAIDESPVPEETLNFETPDADAQVYSAGISHRANDKFRVAAGYLYAKKERRSVSNAEIDGPFESSVHIINASISYFF